MANARASTLQSQRSTFGYGRFGGATRVSTSLSSSASSIAKNAQGAELSTMTSKYNDGVIGNEEMRAFLQKMLTSSLLSPTEKADVESRVRDFDVRVRTGQMEAIYKNSPDNSLQKVQSAKTMANYYRSLAGSLQADTPAYSNYLEKAGQWEQVATTETAQVNKASRAIKRNQLFTEVYKSPPNSSQEALQKYQAFVELANQANADGDVQAATQFSMYAQQAYSDAQATQGREAEAATREAAQGNRKSLNDYINTTMNDYKDGKISAEQAMINLNSADEQASSLGETSINVRLNTLAQGIYTDVQKGRSYQTSESGNFGFKSATGTGVAGDELLFNLESGQLNYAQNTPTTSTKTPTNVKGNAKSLTPLQKAQSNGGNVTIHDLNKLYETEEKKLKQSYLSGKINGNDYKNGLAILNAEKVKDYGSISQQLSTLDPNAKVRMNGSKQRVGDLVDTMTKVVEEGTTNAELYANPNIAPVTKLGTKGYYVDFVDVNQFTKEMGGVTGKGKNWIYSSQGEPMKIQEEVIKDYLEAKGGDWLPPEGYKSIDDMGDANLGKYVKETKNRYVDVGDAVTGKTIRYYENPENKQWVPSYNAPKGDSALWDDSSKQMKILSDYIGKSKETVRPMTQSQLDQFVKSKTYEKVLGKDYMLDQDPTRKVDIVQPGQPFSKVGNKDVTVLSATRPLTISPKAATSNAALEQELNANPGLAVVKPVDPTKLAAIPEGYTAAPVANVSKPQSNVTQQIQSGLSSGGLKIMSQPAKPVTPSAAPPVTLSLPKVNQAVSTGGLKVNQVGSTKAPAKAPSIIDQVKKVASGIGTKIKSLFKW